MLPSLLPNSKKSIFAPLVSVGVILSLLAAFVFELYLAFTTAMFLIIAITAMTSVDRKYVPFSWQFGIPAFYMLMFVILPLANRVSGTLPAVVSDSEIADAMLVLTVGIAAFWGGSKFFLNLRSDTYHLGMTSIRELDILSKSWALGSLLVMGGLSMIWSYFFGYYGLLVTSANDLSKGAGLAATLAFFVMIAHSITWTIFLETRRRTFLILGIFSILIMAGSGIISNSKTQLMLPFFLTGISVWGVTGKFPTRLILASLVIYIFVAYPVVTALRGGVLASYDDSSRKELAELIWEFVSAGEWTNFANETSATQSLDRGLLPYFTQIVAQAGNNVEYFYGETFKSALEIFVPRFLYPDKPDMNIGNWTAQAFGVLLPYDTVTNLSPTYIGEFYMNFGLIGVIVGMFLIGITAVLVDRHVIVSRRSWTMPIMIFAILWQESVIGHTLLPFIKNILLLVPVIFIFNSIASLKRYKEVPQVLRGNA